MFPETGFGKSRCFIILVLILDSAPIKEVCGKDVSMTTDKRNTSIRKFNVLIFTLA
jgi:hypothetical protein